MKKDISQHTVPMARDLLVVDESIYTVAKPLSDEKIRIIPIEPNADEKIKEAYLSGRILVTNNTKDFIKDAKKLEYGIISVEDVRFKDPNILANLISKAIIKHKLWSRKDSFLVKITDKGSTFVNL
jgi:hypothetical protein